MSGLASMRIHAYLPVRVESAHVRQVMERPLQYSTKAISMALLFALTAACTTTSKPIPPAKEATAMATSQSTATTSHPNLTAEEIGKRFLKLLEGLESREDLSLERVEKATGLSLLKVSGENYHGYGQKLTEGWFYSFWFYPEKHGGERGIRLEFDHPGDRFSDMTTVCALDFNHYHSALKAMGFLANPRYGEIGELRSWEYTKFMKSDGTVAMKVLIIPQNVVAGEAGRLCVKLIHAELN